jgi:hypothetical protein
MMPSILVDAIPPGFDSLTTYHGHTLPAPQPSLNSTMNGSVGVTGHPAGTINPTGNVMSPEIPINKATFSYDPHLLAFSSYGTEVIAHEVGPGYSSSIGRIGFSDSE